MVIKIKGKTLLVLAAGAGMIITAFLAAKKAPEAQAKKEAALQAKREKTGDENAQLTFFESAQAQIGSYIPAIVCGMATLGSFAGSEIINKENMKKAEKAFNEYKDMTETLGGTGARKTIEKAVEQKRIDEKNGKPWESKEMFRIVFQGHSIQFEDTRANVMEALYETNRYFHGRGRITFNEFLHFLDQAPVDEGEDRGWEAYVGEAVYGYTWIDFGLKECEDEPWITEIYMPVYPHFFDEDDCQDEIEDGVRKLSLNDSGAPYDG